MVISREETNICLSCGECCKRYNITIFPEDVQKISKRMRISKKKFLEENCQLFVKVFPKSTSGILTFPTSSFPKSITNLLEREIDFLSKKFFVLPQIVLKRTNGKCFFLEENNKCRIYSVRPDPCKLFPFIVVPGFEEQYPFCELFKTTKKDYSKQSRKYSKKVREYFDLIEKKGFEKVWKNPPKKGLFFLNESMLGEISIKEINSMTRRKKD